MLHKFVAQTYATPTTETYSTHRMRIATGCHKMSSVDHLHIEAKLLKLREHSELLSAQYLARDTPKRRMKETLFIRPRSNVEPMMITKDKKATLQAIHTSAVNQAVNSQEVNVLLDDCHPLINNSENDLTRKEHTALGQLRSGHCICPVGFLVAFECLSVLLQSIVMLIVVLMGRWSDDSAC